MGWDLGFRFQVFSFWLCELRKDCRFTIAYCLLPFADCRLQTGDWRLPTADCPSQPLRLAFPWNLSLITS